MTDEQHPNERLVTPSEDGEGFDRSLVSRRDLLAGSTMLAGLLAYTSDPSEPMNPRGGIARASDNPDEPLITLGPESDPICYLFQDTAGGIILQDATSGNHFWYNESQGRWETDAPLDIPSLVDESILSFFDGSELTADVNNTSITTEDGTIGGDPILGMPGSSSDTSLTLGGGWVTIDANQPVALLITTFVQTDGTSNGIVDADVDESGGTSADYTLVTRASAAAGSGTEVENGFTLLLPPGAQVQVRNENDPANANSLVQDRAFVLSS